MECLLSKSILEYKHLRYNNLNNYFNAIASAQYDVDSHISLMYRGNVQYTNTESSHNDGWSSSMIDATAITSSYYKYNTTLANYYGDLMANFNYDLTDDLNMMLNVGHNYQEWRTNNMSAGGTGIQIPGIYQGMEFIKSGPAI